LLVIIIGAILGLALGNSIFSSSTGISSYACLLVSLALPSLLFFFSDKMKEGEKGAFIVFIVAELVINILFLSNLKWTVKSFWIAQAITIGIFLIAFLIALAIYKSEEK